jgi:hypothetical protein
MTNQAVQPPAANPELAHISRRFPAWRTLPFSKTIVLVLRRRPSFSIFVRVGSDSGTRGRELVPIEH